MTNVKVLGQLFGLTRQLLSVEAIHFYHRSVHQLYQLVCPESRKAYVCEVYETAYNKDGKTPSATFFIKAVYNIAEDGSLAKSCAGYDKLVLADSRDKGSKAHRNFAGLTGEMLKARKESLKVYALVEPNLY